MSFSDTPSVRPTVLPAAFCRTLQHLSCIMQPTTFRLHGGNQTGYIIPEELYSDPTMGFGMRVWTSQPGIRLNTPQPIMSACEAPPNQPDPFSSGPHPIRDLGSPSWTTESHQPQAQLRRAILQLTAEEDQAVTNLLKLHHQEAHLDLSGPAGCSAPSSDSVNAQYPERPRRVQAALLTGFNQRDTGSVGTPNETAGGEDLPQNPGTLPVWSKTDEHESNAATLRPVGLKRRRLEELTDLEEDAVSVLLSLSDAVIF